VTFFGLPTAPGADTLIVPTLVFVVGFASKATVIVPSLPPLAPLVTRNHDVDVLAV